MSICKDCICRKYCGDDDIRRCDRYFRDGSIKAKEQTNEEWLRQATTEQLADKLTDFSFMLVVELPTNERREKVRNKLLEWLKQPHH